MACWEQAGTMPLYCCQPQVTELRAASEAEGAARREAESALRTASKLFKRELQEKNAALEGLRAEVAALRSGAAAAAGVPGSPTPLLTYHVPAVVLPPGSPLASGSPSIGAYHGVAAVPTRSAHSSPGKAALGRSAAGNAAQRELALLRAARRDYQQALAEQESLKACLTKAITDAVRVPVEPAVAAASPRPGTAGRMAASVLGSSRVGSPVPRALF